MNIAAGFLDMGSAGRIKVIGIQNYHGDIIIDIVKNIFEEKKAVKADRSAEVDKAEETDGEASEEKSKDKKGKK